jgi:hypothetical protein
MLRTGPRLSLAAAAAIVGGLAAAPALGAATGTVTVTPNVAGKPSHVSFDIKPDGGNPKTLIIRATRGFKFEPRAVAKRCDPAHAKANKCPAKSKMGDGTTDVTVHQNAGVLADSHLTVAFQIFVAPPVKAGDVSGVVVHYKEPQTKQEGSITGRVYKGAPAPFDLIIRFDKVDETVKAPQGFSVRVDRLQASFGAKRTVKKTVHKNGKTKTKKVRYDLVTNAKTCNGSWPYEIEQVFANSNPTTSGSAPCTP